jgi:hypothetical protein
VQELCILHLCEAWWLEWTSDLWIQVTPVLLVWIWILPVSTTWQAPLCPQDSHRPHKSKYPGIQAPRYKDDLVKRYRTVLYLIKAKDPSYLSCTLNRLLFAEVHWQRISKWTKISLFFLYYNLQVKNQKSQLLKKVFWSLNKEAHTNTHTHTHTHTLSIVTYSGKKPTNLRSSTCSGF